MPYKHLFFFRNKREMLFLPLSVLFLILLSVPAAIAEVSSNPTQTTGRNDDSLVSAPASTVICSCPTTTQYAKSNLFTLQPYKPVYAIVAYNWTLSNGVSGVQNGEMQFQLSFKIPLANIPWANGQFAFGYTQVSFWQIFSNSPYFRETNYAPEFMSYFDYKTTAVGLNNIHTTFGLLHQSNGRGGEEERSWNRVYTEVLLEWDHFFLGLKPWYRIPEQQKSSPTDARGDDNPDIERYLGYGELTAGYQNKGWSLQLTARNNLLGSQNNGSTQLDLTLPIWHDAKFYIQVFEGYGLDLIDYNRRITHIGCGVLLAKWP